MNQGIQPGLTKSTSRPGMFRATTSLGGKPRLKKRKSSLVFNGSNYGSIQDSLDLARPLNFTFSTWFRFDTLTTPNLSAFLSSYFGATKYFIIRLNGIVSGVLSISVEGRDSTVYTQGHGLGSANRLSHFLQLAFEPSGANTFYRVLIDGREQGNGFTIPSTSIPATFPATIDIGRDSNTNARLMPKMRMGDWRLLSETLTLAQHKAIYTSGPAGLLLEKYSHIIKYKFPNNLKDASGNGRNLILTGQEQYLNL